MNEQRDIGSGARGIRGAVLFGLFVGTGVGLGHLLGGVPNLELVTLTSALAGAALGPRAGAGAGALTAALFSLGNPYGPPIPWLLAAQALGQALAGVLGGLAAPRLEALRRTRRRRRAVLLAGGVGLAATLAYDLLTNAAGLLAFDLSPRVVVVGAVPYALLHLAGNVPIFAMLLPVLGPRAAALARPSLRGTPAAALLLVCLTLPAAARAQADAPADSLAATPAGATAAEDSLHAGGAGIPPPAAAAADSLEAGPSPDPWGRRPLWEPFAGNLLELLEREGPWRVRADGGFGSRAVLLGEAGTAYAPLVLRDGLPLGTGHRWTDDLWTVPLTGVEAAGLAAGADGWGGTAGAVRLRADDRRPEETITDTRFYKGPHETFLRSFSFRTPRAPWRLRFDFEETLDQQGYDFQVPGDVRFLGRPGLGESKFRSGRGSLERWLPDGQRLRVSVERVRKHKTGLPSIGVDHEELWSEHAAVDWLRGTGAGRLRMALFWNGRDVVRDGERKLEARRDGLLLQLGGDAGRRLRLTALDWDVRDSGAPESWAGEDAGPVRGEGQEAALEGAWPWRRPGVTGELGLSGWWDAYGGWRLGGRLECGAAAERPWWRLSLQRGGRAPRSDELLTAERVAVPGTDGTERIALLPERDLRREDTWRGGLDLRARLLGTDLALAGSATWLRDGITWRALPGDATRGRWTNGLEMVTPAVTGSLERAGRLLGWARLRLEAGWQRPSVKEGKPFLLPPESWARLRFLWEKHLFAEDGIFQIGYWLTRLGEMKDPWYPAGIADLPALTRHDLTLGFRLLGADLELEFRNLTDESLRLSTGALSDGREMRYRLHWTFTR